MLNFSKLKPRTLHIKPQLLNPKPLPLNPNPHPQTPESQVQTKIFPPKPLFQTQTSKPLILNA